MEKNKKEKREICHKLVTVLFYALTVIASLSFMFLNIGSLIQTEIQTKVLVGSDSNDDVVQAFKITDMCITIVFAMIIISGFTFGVYIAHIFEMMKDLKELREKEEAEKETQLKV